MISRSHRPRHRLLLVAALLPAVAGIGCSSTDNTSPSSLGPPNLLGVTAGSALSTTVGATVASPMTVRVWDINGHVLPNVTVTWTPNTAEGSVTATAGGVGAASATSVTDNTGLATAFWTVGTKSGTLVDTLIASVTGANNTGIFTATVKASTVTTIAASPASGAAQTVAHGSAVTLQVLTTDSFGNPTAASVTFSGAGGTFSASGKVTTNATTGLGSVTFTPTAAGVFTITTAATGATTTATFVITGT